MKQLLLPLLVMALTACGGSGAGNNDNSGNPSNPGYTPEITALNQIRLVDAQGAPLADAEVTVSPATATASIRIAEASAPLTTDSQGNLILNNLAPGRYTLTITIQGVTVTSIIEIAADNADTSATIAAPVVLDANGPVALQDEEGNNLAIFASVSGVIYSSAGPIEGAQISLSGGTETNGAVSSDITDADGRYLLIVNVTRNKLEAMESATLRIVKDGFINVSLPFNATTALAFIGQNFALQTAPAGSSIVYGDDFNQTTGNATCGGWSTTALPGSPVDSEEPEMQPQTVIDDDSNALTNLWHRHTSGLNIINQALINNLVEVAPDDTSNGKVPEPFDTAACWYGQADAGTGQGNFLGDYSSGNGGTEADGGTSDRDNGGALESPVLDLSAEVAPLAFTFRTWWEIESVNPNENGYDLLIIEYSLDGGDSWNDLARLNPLSDPESGCINRAPLPFSNRGYNRAPAWLWQEPIDISGLAGEANARLRFVFRSQDELYNGFRGWLIDDVRIIREAGTFPHYEDSGEVIPADIPVDECFEDDNCEDSCNAELSVFKTGASRNGQQLELVKQIRR